VFVGLNIGGFVVLNIGVFVGLKTLNFRHNLPPSEREYFLV
jgi:hypothetical protein